MLNMHKEKFVLTNIRLGNVGVVLDGKDILESLVHIDLGAA